jgi:dihydrofolate reductase
MRPTTAVFIATSLDGFIARSDGGIDWLLQANTRVPAGEDCGYQAFMDSVDALVMGRKTFEQALQFNPWPYAGKPVVVLSRDGVNVPATLRDEVSVSAEALPDLLARLATAGARKLYIDGGQTIQGFLRAGVLDELIVTVIPVLLGEGLPLFGPLAADVALTHVATRAYPFGFVQHHYRVSHTA